MLTISGCTVDLGYAEWYNNRSMRN